MTMKKGEKYECSNPECGCEITVTKGSEAPDANRPPQCGCGDEMIVKTNLKPATAGGGR